MYKLTFVVRLYHRTTLSTIFVCFRDIFSWFVFVISTFATRSARIFVYSSASLLFWYLQYFASWEGNMVVSLRLWSSFTFVTSQYYVATVTTGKMLGCDSKRLRSTRNTWTDPLYNFLPSILVFHWRKQIVLIYSRDLVYSCTHRDEISRNIPAVEWSFSWTGLPRCPRICVEICSTWKRQTKPVRGLVWLWHMYVLLRFLPLKAIFVSRNS